MANILQNLLANIPMPQDTATDPDTVNLLRNLMAVKNSPKDFAENPAYATGQSLNALAQLIGGTVNSQIKGATPAVKGAVDFGAGALGLQKPELSPYQKGVEKALKKAGEDHTVEAIQQGVPPQHIEQESGINNLLYNQNDMGIQEGMDQSISKNNYKKNQSQYRNTAQGILSKLLGQDLNPEYTGQQLDNQLKRQKLRGEEPLQIGEKEKIELVQQGKFFENIAEAANKQPSGQEATLLGNINSGLRQIDSLSSALQKDPNVFKEWVMPGNPNRAAIESMNEDVIDVLGRLRSQGAISKDEEVRFKKQLPQIGGLINIESPKVAKFKLDKLKGLLSDIKQTATPRTSDFAQKVMKLRQMGATDEQIYKAYRGK